MINKVYIYTNRCQDGTKGFSDKISNLPEVMALPRTIEIEATDILIADKEYEKLTGVNPVRHKKHTPPILVSIK